MKEKTTATNLKSLREKLGLSKRAISKQVGISYTAWMQYENSVCLPRIPVAQRVIEYAKDNGIQIDLEYIYPTTSKKK